MVTQLAVFPVLAEAATNAPPAGGSVFGPMGYMLLLLGIMYFLIFRPQQQKAKEHREMVTRLKVGDRIVTSAGIHGDVTAVDEANLMVRIADGVEIKLVRSAVGSVLRQAEESGSGVADKGGKPERKDRKPGK